MNNLKKNRPKNKVMEVEEEKKEQKNLMVEKKVFNLEFFLAPCNWLKTDYTEFKAICRTWLFVKDKDFSINWKKPLIQESQISTIVWINKVSLSQLVLIVMPSIWRILI